MYHTRNESMLWQKLCSIDNNKLIREDNKYLWDSGGI